VSQEPKWLPKSQNNSWCLNSQINAVFGTQESEKPGFPSLYNCTPLTTTPPFVPLELLHTPPWETGRTRTRSRTRIRRFRGDPDRLSGAILENKKEDFTLFEAVSVCTIRVVADATMEDLKNRKVSWRPRCLSGAILENKKEDFTLFKAASQCSSIGTTESIVRIILFLIFTKRVRTSRDVLFEHDLKS
ncbi:hypothetical protein SDJN02_19769, partial [Cucurbita argyrosperma subsp. argyrosperma]